MDDATRDNSAAMRAIQLAVDKNGAAVVRLADRVGQFDDDGDGEDAEEE